MAFYKIDLTGAPSLIRAIFNELPHIETEVHSDVIIAKATEKELADAAQRIQIKAAVNDVEIDFSIIMHPVSESAVVNGKTVEAHFAEQSR